jgi:hypothetical protein
MKNDRHYFTNQEVKELLATQTGLSDGRWVVARPYNYYGFKWRLKAALEVFKGNAFPVEWK